MAKKRIKVGAGERAALVQTVGGAYHVLFAAAERLQEPNLTAGLTLIAEGMRKIAELPAPVAQRGPRAVVGQVS
jgi:hypothetical protein